MITVQQITNYLSENVSDPVPKYILAKEIYRKEPSSPEYVNAYNDMKQSKWYRGLADEQWDNGSWGRFHTQDSKTPIKQNFTTTESALGRARDLSLSKDDPMIAKCIKLMERYVRGEETWTDNIEKHKDNGRGHLFSRPFMTAANINMFDPDNPVIKPLRDAVAEALKAAFAAGSFDKHYWGFDPDNTLIKSLLDIVAETLKTAFAIDRCDENCWKQENGKYYIPGVVAPGSMYGSLLLQNTNCIDDTLQRQWLDYIWNKKEGIYYVSSIPPAEKQSLEDKRFNEWFRTLELLSGFSLFPDFMKDGAFPHLLNEVDRLINGDVVLSHIKAGRYAENWGRDKNRRKTDMILRIARILVKC